MVKKLFFLLMTVLFICSMLITGCGGGSNNKESTPPTPPPSPPAVISVTPADKQLTIDWPAVYDATGYEVWYSTTNDPSTATQVTQSFTGTTCIITDLINGTMYYIWVKAKNTVGTSEWSSVGTGKPTSSIKPPEAPLLVNVIKGDKQLTINWPAVYGASLYEVWYSTSNNSSTAQQFGDSIADISCTITNLINDTTYYIWVKAKNSEGSSNFSPVASGTPTSLKINVTITAEDSITHSIIQDAVATIDGLTSTYSSGGVTYFENVLAENDYTVTVSAPGYPLAQKVIHVGSQNLSEKISMVAYKGIIKGLVNMTGTGNYIITLAELSKTTYYSMSSFFSFNNLAPGTYHLRIDRIGYEPILKQIIVAVDQTVDLGSMDINNPLPAGNTFSYQTLKINNSGVYTQSIDFDISTSQTVAISYYTNWVNSEAKFNKNPFSGTYLVYAHQGWQNGGMSGSKSVAVTPGNYHMSVYRNNLSGGTGWIQCSYNKYTGYPQLTLSKLWCKVKLYDQVAVSCTDSTVGIKSVQMVVTNSMSMPADVSFTTIPANTAIEFNNTGTWFLHIKCTNNANIMKYSLAGPFIIHN